MKRKVYAIILASGKGERLHSGIPKQFIKIKEKTIVEHTITVFNESSNIDEIIVVMEPSYKNYLDDETLLADYKKISKIITGGSTRRESSSVGVNAVPENDAKILIHDAVRPFISTDVINECISALDKYDAIDVAIPATDTIIKTNAKNCIENIPERKYMMQGQTPQAFNSHIIKKAHAMALKDNNETVTDDCGLILKYGLADIFVVKGEIKNIKITYIEDVVYADKLFQLQNDLLNSEIISSRQNFAKEKMFKGKNLSRK
ncbi:MAG TPA: 2-C-methyl-D-erythritol 4-phosphate cytidylyltransferase [bacterium]|nr:2-C-methyl-D-erythritol 4-phosphate cytidylyltransferase [bacterium]HPS30804.1 2-C-methyl-D-erythritol 4-phosphate cytidylyltransferase [bacterium]